MSGAHSAGDVESGAKGGSAGRGAMGKWDSLCRLA
jgi:hypothetical protein